MINFKNIGYEPHKIFNLNVEIKKKDKVMIVGRNGCGKTTFLHLLANLIEPTEGIMEIDSKSIGLIFQNPEDQFLFSTIKEELIFILENKAVNPKLMDKKIYEVLELVELDKPLDTNPFHLSGGQKQKLALACNLLLEPAILLLDEATSMLDYETKHRFLELVNKVVTQKEITLLSVTHEYDEYKYYDYCLEFSQGATKKVIPEEFKYSYEPKDCVIPGIVVQQLQCNIDNYNVLNNVNAIFYKNCINGIVGKIGSGKTTLINHINGTLKVKSGSIKIDDILIDAKTSKKVISELHKSVTTVYQFPENQLFCYTNYEEITFSAKNFRLPINDEEINAYLKLFNLETEILEKSPFELSGGEKRKIAIISTLVIGSDYIILDEPFVGIDNYTKKDMLDFFKELANKKTILMITHDKNLINNYCDCVYEVGANVI